MMFSLMRDALERLSIECFIFYELKNFPFDKFSFRYGLWFLFRFPVCVCWLCALLFSWISHNVVNPYRLFITCVYNMLFYVGTVAEGIAPQSWLLISFSCMASYQIKMLHNQRQTIAKSILFNNNES